MKIYEKFAELLNDYVTTIPFISEPAVAAWEKTHSENVTKFLKEVTSEDAELGENLQRYFSGRTWVPMIESQAAIVRNVQHYTFKDFFADLTSRTARKIYKELN